MSDFSRRSFLRGLGMALAAPAIVHAAGIMPIKAWAESTPTLYGDGTHDDTVALQALLDGKPVMKNGVVIPGKPRPYLGVGTFKVSSCLRIRDNTTIEGSTFVMAEGGRGPILYLPSETNYSIRNTIFKCGDAGVLFAPS